MLLVFLLGIALAFFAGRHVYRGALTPKSGPPRCGKCGYEVSRNSTGLTRCPECGGDYIEVGIIAPGSRGERAASPASMAASLAALVAVLAILIYLPISIGWPITSQNTRGSSVYTPSSSRSSPRLISVDMNVDFVPGHKAHDGWLVITVKNPGARTASLRIDAESRIILSVDSTIKIKTGSPLSPSDVRTLYNAVGLDTTTDPKLASEADAVAAEVKADLDDPQAMGSGSFISTGGTVPALSRTGGGFAVSGESAVVLLGRLHIPLLLAYSISVIAFYLLMLATALRVQEHNRVRAAN